ncbi:hypothetical protein EDD22DRAFT_504028 [Suillus occidentalis]|nr:hypothetical protein EDD22DRAFT_504028 [Suillus occidentalis]
MAQMNTGAVDSNEISLFNDDPGAFPFPCGEFAGVRLDAVSGNLRRWATQAHLARHSWYPAYMKANERYEELLLQTPEAYPFPFGEHEDKRLDEVPEGLIWWSVHPSRSCRVWHRNLVEAHRLYLDKVYNQKSPSSVTISDYGRGSVEPDNDHERDGQGDGGVSKLANNTDNSAVNDDSGRHDDIPPDELRHKTTTKRLCKGRVRSLDNRQRICHSSSGKETDTADELPLKRLSRRSEHEVQRSAQTDSHSDLGSAALDDPETLALHQLTQSFSALSLSQESAGSLNNDNELPRVPRKAARLQGKSGRRASGNGDSDKPEYNTHTHTPSRLGRGYRVLVQ